MDNFTAQLIELSYETCKTRKRKRSSPVTADELAQQTERHWLTYRDGTIAMWASHVQARAKQHRLATLARRVYGLLVQHGEYWELPDEDDPPHRWAEWTAWGIAVLRWIHLEIAGKAPAPYYTVDELVVWLSERQLEQLPLFQLRSE